MLYLPIRSICGKLIRTKLRDRCLEMEKNFAMHRIMNHLIHLAIENAQYDLYSEIIEFYNGEKGK